MLPGEILPPLQSTDHSIDFRRCQSSESAIDGFSLRYLAKFVTEQRSLEKVAIHGTLMPLADIAGNRLTSLNLRGAGLYSEDLYVLSQVLKQNSSLTEINLSRNYIGLSYSEEG